MRLTKYAFADTLSRFLMLVGLLRESSFIDSFDESGRPYKYIDK
jgi:hypothetical protein